MAATYDPELIVLAGGVPSTGAVFLDVIRDQITHRAAGSELAARRLRPEQVVLADISDPPGPRGAALIAVDDIFRERVSLPAAKKANNR
jgi:predicted NBD/HSP70 family sugar kinase